MLKIRALCLSDLHLGSETSVLTAVDRTIVYVPGNHDHHLWETARERQYAAYINEDSIKLPLEHVPWHATHLFPWREKLNVPNRDVESFLLTTR